MGIFLKSFSPTTLRLPAVKYWVDMLKRTLLLQSLRSTSSEQREQWVTLHRADVGNEYLVQEEQSLQKKMMMWSVERSSCRNSEKGMEPVPCCIAMQGPWATENPSEAKTLKVNGNTFSCCFLGLLNVSSRDSCALGLPALSIKSYRAHSHKSVGKKIICIFKDLIPLTHGYRRK